MKKIFDNNYCYYFVLKILVVNYFFEFAEASTKLKDYALFPEIYSYQQPRRGADLNQDDISSSGGGSSSSVSTKSARSAKSIPKTIPAKKFEISSSGSLEEYTETAISGNSIEWEILPESEMPRRSPSDSLSGYFTHINVPLFYGNDIESKYGLTGDSVKRSFFAIYVRKYHWGTLDYSRPIKHVILVAGGPGESGRSWTTKLSKLSRQYGRENLVLYVADHRGVFKSRDVVELIIKETEKGQTRTSWKKVRRNEHVSEKSWMSNVREFEKQVGYPLVAMSCSNAARDLALISLVIRKHLPRSDARFYLHAQSYGTQVSTRTLILLPNFYDGVLLEGLATMELVKESAKADFGILSSCAEDRKCSQMFSKTPTTRGLLPLSGPFDLRKLLDGMAQKPHNKQCRELFLTKMRDHVYTESTSFWGAMYLSFYELLADDFANVYTGSKGNFYPGMLVLPFIRDMYYCEDIERFRRQVTKFIEVIAVSVRGLNQPYVKTPSKSKPVDANQIRSHFVQTYINAHEAFDMQRMTSAIERGYCDRSNHPDLINQCSIWKEQVRKMKLLKDLTGTPDLLPKDAATSRTMMTSAEVRKRDKIDVFEGRYPEGQKKEKAERSDSISSASTSTSTSSSDSDTNLISSTIKLFTFNDNDKKKKKTSHKNKKNRRSHGKRKIKKPTSSFSDLFSWNSWKKDPKTELNVNDDVGVDLTKHFKDHEKRKQKKNSPISPQSDQEDIKVKSNTRGSLDHARKYYYNVEDDELAYGAPVTQKTRVFVTVGSLDVKTPLLEARRLVSRIRSPFKTLFELKNVAHATDPCRTEILRAMIAEGPEEQRVAMALAGECVDELAGDRKLDWQFEDVKNIRKEDWIV